MTDEDIRKAACEAFDGASPTEGSLIKSIMFTEVALRSMDAVFRAGMEAGRAEAAVKPKRQKAPACAVERPVDVQEQTWEDWLTLRRTKKAAVTKTVMNAAKIEAVKAGLTLEGFLRVWCYRGSQGLEAAWITQNDRSKLAAGRMDRQLETAALMTGAARPAPTDMGEIYDVGQQRIASR